MFSKPFPKKTLIIIVFSLLIFGCKKENIIYPQPTFQLTRSSYYQGETVQLNADFPVAGEVYTWDFGDGTSAQGSSVTHKYNAGGIYYIILSNQSTGLPSTGLVSTENGYLKKINIFNGNASFRATSRPPIYYNDSFGNVWESTTVPNASTIAPVNSYVYKPANPVAATDTIFINIIDQKTPIYANIIGTAGYTQFSYSGLLDNTKLYQNQLIILTDTTTVYTTIFFSGPQKKLGTL